MATPWATIAKANGIDLNPGDQVLFRAGDSFAGRLALTAQDAGTAANPVVVGSYGAGRATINAGGGSGITVDDAGGIRVQDLAVVGSGAGTNIGNGIAIINSLTNNSKLSYVRVDNVDVSGFGGADGSDGRGILVGGAASDGSKSGFNDVRITRSAAHGNEYFGILFTGAWSETDPLYANTNVYVGHCTVYDNLGDITYLTNHSGSGILLEDVDGGMVERCVAYNNGGQCKSSAGGPIGIWAAVANNITIQYCESHSNRSQRFDGGGFDFDGGTTNSVMQYNYSHDNDGAGYLIYTYPGAPHSDENNVLRYNVSQNDARRYSFGAIHIQEGVSNIDVYNNTVFMDASVAAGTVTSKAALKIVGTPTNVRVRNNIFTVTGSGATTPRVIDSTRNSGVLFQGNAYHAYAGTFVLRFGGVNYASLANFRAATNTGGQAQEKVGTTNAGFQGDPLVLSAGNGQTLGDADNLYQLTAYQLQSGSPLINAGLNLRSAPFNIANLGTRDFDGTAIPASGTTAPVGGAFDIGADEKGPATIAGRFVFYNNSIFDGYDAAANAADDAAIASDKSALLPGQTATFANYTSYYRGVNGVMIDVAGLTGTPTVSDFVFRNGNTTTPGSWSATAAPTSITVRRGAGIGGSDRVTIVWSNAAKKRWLSVRLAAGAATGLAAADVFYFGNAIGESNSPSTETAVVNATDEIATRNNFTPSAAIFNWYDYNRDGKVDATDEALARNNATTNLTALILLSP